MFCINLFPILKRMCITTHSFCIKKLNELISEKGMIISISNNPIWDFISVIPK